MAAVLRYGQQMEKDCILVLLLLHSLFPKTEMFSLETKQSGGKLMRHLDL
jgi:hypothetical protein